METLTKQVIEGNTLIARFMELPEHEDTDDNLMFEYIEDNLWYPKDLKYHSSWAWLMPVVETIDRIGFDVQISRISVKISEILDNENPIVSLVCGDISKKIEIVWLAVIEFITWYNSKN